MSNTNIASVRVMLEQRPVLKKIIDNIGWLFFDKLLRLGGGVIVTIWLARYLGPEQFGTFNFAMAFVALFTSVATLGLDGIVVRDIVNKPGGVYETLGTAFVLRILGGLTAITIAIAGISFLRPENALIKLMVFVFGFTMIFKATEVVKYWFESQVTSKYSVWVENGIFLIFVVIKISMIFLGAPLMAFVWAVLAESVLTAIGLMSIYNWRNSVFLRWRLRLDRARCLLKDSWPLILSGLAITVYMRIDQIMLGQMIGDHAVGAYSAAVRISETAYFVPMAIVASVFPSILEAKKQSEVLYLKRLQQLFNVMVILAVGIALPMTFLSDWLIQLLFGADYKEAATVLVIHIWSCVFVFLGVASGKWLLTENLQKHAFWRAACGAIINVLLNIYLVPKKGVVGAAVATLISQMFATYIYDVLRADVRISFWMKTKSILFIGWR